MTFYRHKECEACQTIEDALRDLVISCTVVSAEEISRSDDLPVKPNAPILEDEGKVIEGEKPILDYLDTLRNFRHQWYKYQSDTCYCDDE